MPHVIDLTRANMMINIPEAYAVLAKLDAVLEAGGVG
jgi:hypothetical protein